MKEPDRSWNELERRVRKGEKGIRILASIIAVRRKALEDAEKDPTRQNVRRRSSQQG